MVRLKEEEYKIYISDYQISIPYGAIKRQSKRSISLSKLLFQFLMVRLKVKSPMNFIFLKIKFQFLMVRLKGTYNF